MPRSSRGSTTLFAGLIALLGAPTPCVAAQPALPSPDEVLKAIRGNIAAYAASLPSFSCVEHISSQELHNGDVARDTQVVSNLRVKHPEADIHPDHLAEIRDVETVNGRPEKNKSRFPKLPLSISGAFGDAFMSLFNDAVSTCYSYRVEQSDASSSPPAVKLLITAIADVNASAACAQVAPDSHAELILDPTSFEILSISTDFPHAHEDGYSHLKISYAYAPVTLANMNFFLPEAVTAEISKPSGNASLRYQAHYSDYHKYDVTTKLIFSSPDAPTQ